MLPKFLRPRGAPFRRRPGAGCQVICKGGKRVGQAMSGAPLHYQTPHEEGPHDRAASPVPTTIKLATLMPGSLVPKTAATFRCFCMVCGAQFCAGWLFQLRIPKPQTPSCPFSKSDGALIKRPITHRHAHFNLLQETP